MRVAIICDYLEENWHSMDLVAEMLFENLHTNHASDLQATRIRPTMKRRYTRSLLFGKMDFVYDADRCSIASGTIHDC